MKRQSRLSLFLIVICLFIYACEKENGSLVNPSIDSPFLSSLTVDNSTLNLDTTTSAAVSRLPNGTFRISGTISANATDPNGAEDLNLVTYSIHKPNTTDQIVGGSLTKSGASFSGNFTFVIDRSDVGMYQIEARAKDRSGLSSNALSVPLTITRNNSKPLAWNPVAPDTLQRPPTGFSPPILFSLTASDSDGYNDIVKVFFQRISPPGGINEMFDDGSLTLHGDSAAGDGVFALKVQIGANAILGNQVFVFLAQDRSGALSDSLFRTVTVIP
ncbi:MAG TPA: hypothetical protein VL633_03790 [Bacteroidota bacterium]|jgi:hypothetical protein|nr:hypothetical protein [Bacteroidota bacterium]